MFISALDTARDEEHQTIWPRQVHKLVPPAIHHQSNIETWGLEGKEKSSAYQDFCLGYFDLV